MAARFAPSKRGQAAPTAMPKMGAASNVNHDKSLVLRAPRIRAVATRNYGKGAPSPYPDQDTVNYGSGVSGPQE